MEDKTVRELLGWTITVWKEPDYDADLTWMGEYSRTPNEYAIETGRGNKYLPYFNPPFENYQGSSEEEIKKYCQQDFEHMEGYGITWGMVAVKATISYKGIQLGSASVWGVEDRWDGKSEWQDEIKDDILWQAFEDVRKNLEILRGVE